MNVNEFLATLKGIADNYKTVYMWGVFGSPVTEKVISQKAKQYPAWYTRKRQKIFEPLIGKGYFGFDCVGLIKGVLWGWAGDHSKYHGGAIYAANNVPDISANMMIQRVDTISTAGYPSDFSKIVPGEVVWLEGHVGVYVGEGTVIECTPAWKNGVQITSCLNVYQDNRLDEARIWVKHGRLPYVDYEGVD